MGLAVACLVFAGSIALAPQPALDEATQKATAKLLAQYGQKESQRIERGVRQVRKMWRDSDGDSQAFQEFVTSEFLPAGAQLDQTFERLEYALEKTDGYLNSLARDLRRGLDLEIGDILPVDHRLGQFDPAIHVSEDLFQTKIAFLALLNFRDTTLTEKAAEGRGWSRRQWAETRLAGRFTSRYSPDSSAKLLHAYSAASTYIAGYTIHADHLLTRDGRRLFPEGLQLQSHWGLRDEIKANYGTPDGLEKQRILARVMDAIVQQTIPAAAIDHPVDWCPETGEIKASPTVEADVRYQKWLDIFRAERLVDAENPFFPTFFHRRYEHDRELSEQEITELLETVLRAEESGPVTRLVRQRLGRPLEAFDIYFSGFAPSSGTDFAALDRTLRERYPSPKEFSADLPRVLQVLGFSDERAKYLAEKIVVDPSRGAGHALGMQRRDDKAHLRTRFEKGGMDYKGFNIAIHELGHNVEQVFSTVLIDHFSLRGVPNNAMTEALAFVFQSRDLEVVGMAKKSTDDTKALHEFWETRQVAGAALVDMRAWRWLYQNQDATTAEFRAAVVRIAKEVWNEFFAAHFGLRDATILAVYSHMIDSGLYLPDYPLARLVAFQVERHFETIKGPIGTEFERVAKIGYVTPGEWMRQAVGSGFSAEPLMTAVRQELSR